MHFFLKCSKVRDFWNVILNWLECLSEINFKNIPTFNKCILFGYPNPSPKTKDKIHVINYCIFYIKYYIYIQTFFLTKTTLMYILAKMQLKIAIEIEFDLNKRKYKPIIPLQKKDTQVIDVTQICLVLIYLVRTLMHKHLLLIRVFKCHHVTK